MTTVDAGAVFVIALHVPPALLDSTKLEGVSAYRTGHSAGWKDAESVLAIITDSLVDKIQAWYGQNMGRILSGNCRKRHHNTDRSKQNARKRLWLQTAAITGEKGRVCKAE